MKIECTRPSRGYIICPECGKEFQSLGYARHRAMHRDRRREKEQRSANGD